MIHRSGCPDNLDPCDCGDNRKEPEGFVHSVRDTAGGLRFIDHAHETMLIPGHLAVDIDGRAFGVSAVQ